MAVLEALKWANFNHASDEATSAEGTETQDVAPAADGPPSSSGTQLVRQDAFLEEDEEEEALEQAMMKCKKCHLETHLAEAVIRSPIELWCRECNSIYTMLRRHQQWPPASFAKLDDAAQAQFWQRCKRQRDEGAKQFSYARIRDTLCTSLAEEVRKERFVGCSGTYLPLSV
eukprot:s1370_g12.t1